MDINVAVTKTITKAAMCTQTAPAYAAASLAPSAVVDVTTSMMEARPGIVTGTSSLASATSSATSSGGILDIIDTVIGVGGGDENRTEVEEWVEKAESRTIDCDGW